MINSKSIPAANVMLKRVYGPATGDDGARVLVDRLWPRGVSKDRAALTRWCKEVAPSTTLRKWFGHDLTRWSEFRQRYKSELKRNVASVAALRQLAKQGRITLVYGARDKIHNEAVVLREFLLGR